MSLNTSRNKSQGISSAILLRNAWRKIGTWFTKMPSKKKEVVSVFVCNGKAKPKKSFSSDWAENLAESKKGSYFDQEQWLKEFNGSQAPTATRRFPHQHSVQGD